MAETALAVVDLRRKASERPAGIDPVQWLNTIDADWRTNFPIQIDDATVAQLIEGFVRNVIPPPPETQLVARVARIRDGHLEFGIEFAETASADSLLRQGWRDRLDGALRARLVPDGGFADALDGVPAIVERLSGTDEAVWQLRCTMPQARRIVWGVDLATEARVSITYDSRILGQGILPGGEAADTDIAVFSLPDGAREDDPGVLHLIGTGATRTRARQVAVLLPKDWRRSCEAQSSPDAPQSFAERLAAEEGRELLKVQGIVTFHAPDGTNYRVFTGADGDRCARYFVGGDRFDELEATYPIVRGVPEIWQSLDQGAVSRVSPRRIRIRHALRGGPWMDLHASRIPSGLLQARVEERDGNASFLRFARVPAAAQIDRSASGNGRGTIAFTGFEGATLDVCPPSGTTVELRYDAATDRHEVIVSADTAVDAPRLAVELRWPQGGSLRAEMLVLLRQAGIYRADGSPYQDRSSLTIADLRGGFAASTDQGELVAKLVEPGRPNLHSNRPVIRQRWRISSRLGLSLVIPEIESFLAMSDDLDAYIRLACEVGGIETLRIDVRRYDCTLEALPHGVRLSSATRAAFGRANSAVFDVVGMPITDAAGVEHRLGAIDARDAATLRAVVPVPYGQGSWLVYVRQEGKLRSRPVLVARESVPHSGQMGALPTLMDIADPKEREQALGAAMAQGARGEDSEPLGEIALLIRSASGSLPAQTFDPIRLLPEHPAAALRLVAMAEEKDFDSLLALARELPLSWEWMPLRLWCQAFEAEWKTLRIQLSQRGLEHFADDAIRGRLQSISRKEPRLAPHAALVWRAMGFAAHSPSQGTLAQYLRYLQLPWISLKGAAESRSRDAAEECFKRNDGRRWPGRPSFRPEMAAVLPDFIAKLTGFVHSVLDAPYVAAQVAAGRLPWSHRIERLLRTNRAFDPSYFDEVLAMQILVAWQARCQ